MKTFIQLAKEGKKLMKKYNIKPYKYPKTIIIKNAFEADTQIQDKEEQFDTSPTMGDRLKLSPKKGKSGLPQLEWEWVAKEYWDNWSLERQIGYKYGEKAERVKTIKMLEGMAKESNNNGDGRWTYGQALSDAIKNLKKG